MMSDETWIEAVAELARQAVAAGADSVAVDPVGRTVMCTWPFTNAGHTTPDFTDFNRFYARYTREGTGPMWKPHPFDPVSGMGVCRVCGLGPVEHRPGQVMGVATGGFVAAPVEGEDRYPSILDGGRVR